MFRTPPPPPTHPPPPPLLPSPPQSLSLLPSPIPLPPFPSPLPPYRSSLALMLDTSRETHVTQLSLTLLSPPGQRCSLTWCKEEVKSVLPLAPHSRCYVLLKANAHFPAPTRVLLTDSEGDGEIPGGRYHNTPSSDPRRRSYDSSSPSPKPPSTGSAFSRVTSRLMGRLRNSTGSRSKTMSSHKSYTLVARRQYVEEPPTASRWFMSKTLSHTTLKQSTSVMSLRCAVG